MNGYDFKDGIVAYEAGVDEEDRAYKTAKVDWLEGWNFADKMARYKNIMFSINDDRDTRIIQSIGERR